MASVTPSRELKVNIVDPFTVGTGHMTIRVSYGGADFLDITLHRKLRVPENLRKYNNEAENGMLPIYSVTQYASRLPSYLNKGLVVPIFNREAMSLHFKSSRSYAIKIFAGDNNTVSAEPRIETTTTAMRRKHRLTCGESIKDYLLGEERLDAFKTLTGNSKQFVAGTPELQFQIMLTKRVGMCIVVREVVEDTFVAFSMEGLETNSKILEVKMRIYDTKRIKIEEQMLVVRGKKLEDEKSLHEYEVRDGGIINILIRHDSSDIEVGSSYGSETFSIDRDHLFQKEIDQIQPQDWDRENTIIFNLNLINATTFEKLLGVKTKTPFTLTTYKNAGIPIPRDVYSESKVSPALTQEDMDIANFDAVALSKANKNVLSIPIATDTTSVMPEFLLHSELVAKVREDGGRKCNFR